MLGERLKFFPVTLFTVVMGLCGLALSWRAVETQFGWNDLTSLSILALAIMVFVKISFWYLLKFFKFRPALVKELNHPVRQSFFPAITISLVLISAGLFPYSETVSFYLWIIGAFFHLLLTLFIMRFWMEHTALDIKHINPAWFIPMVGNILMPIVGMNHGMPEVSWFFFAIGLVMWLVLFTLLINRVLFHHPLPDKLYPTLFILLAPPTVGFLSYLQLTAEIDTFARILFYFGLFISFLLISLMPRFVALPFFLSWWAYSFPLAAMVMASLHFSAALDLALLKYFALAIFAVLNVVLLLLIYKTIKAILTKKICVEEKG